MRRREPADVAAKIAPTPPPSFLSRLFFLWGWPILRDGRKLGNALAPSDLPELPASSSPEKVAARLAACWAAELAVRPKKPSLPRAIYSFYGSATPKMLSGAAFMTALLCVQPVLIRVLIDLVQTDGDLRVGAGAIGGIVACTLLCTVVQQHAWYVCAKAAFETWIALTSLIYRKPSTLTREALSRFTEGELVSLMTADCQAYLEVGQFFFFFAAMPFQALLSASLLLWLLGAPFLIGLAVLVLNVVVVERLGNRIRDAQRAKSKHADARGVLVNESLQGARTVKLYAWEAVVAKRVAAVRAKEEAQLVRIARLRAAQQFLSFGVPTAVTVPVFIVYKLVNDTLPAATIFTAVALFEFLNMSLVVLPNLLNELRRAHVSIERIGRFLAVADNFEAPKVSEGGEAAGSVTISGGASFWWGSGAADNAAGGGLSSPPRGASGGGAPPPLALPPPSERKLSRRRRLGYLAAAIQLSGRSNSSLAQSSPQSARPPARTSSTTVASSDTLSTEGGGEAGGAPPEKPAATSDAPALRGIDFEASGGELVLVCGRVGSGKSSLCSALIGLLRTSEGGKVELKGRLAYVPQSSFIMNDTVQGNILFGAPLDAERYARVVTACQLDDDIASLPSGHTTEIGERGITISGGQKQRISIARAAYSEASVVLLDDPLSAMDAHVGGNLFNQCIMKEIAGATRVFCTNQLQLRRARTGSTFYATARSPSPARSRSS